MAQASLPRRHRTAFNPSSLVRFNPRRSHLLRPLSLRNGRLASFALLGGLLTLHPRLVLSVVVGSGIAAIAYFLYEHRHQFQPRLRQIWRQTNRRLTLAIATGSLSAVSVYGIATIWAESDAPWLGTGLLLEGAAALAALGFIAWKVSAPEQAGSSPLRSSAISRPLDYQHWLSQLTDPNPVKRLIAVRQATDWAMHHPNGNPALTQKHPPSKTRAHLADCFRLMLSQETEPTIRAALLDGLQALSVDYQLPVGTRPLSMPVRPSRQVRGTAQREEAIAAVNPSIPDEKSLTY